MAVMSKLVQCFQLSTPWGCSGATSVNTFLVLKLLFIFLGMTLNVKGALVGSSGGLGVGYLKRATAWNERIVGDREYNPKSVP